MLGILSYCCIMFQVYKAVLEKTFLFFLFLPNSVQSDTSQYKVMHMVTYLRELAKYKKKKKMY